MVTDLEILVRSKTKKNNNQIKMKVLETLMRNQKPKSLYKNLKFKIKMKVMTSVTSTMDLKLTRLKRIQMRINKKMKMNSATLKKSLR